MKPHTNRIFSALFCLVLLVAPLQAKVTLPAVFGDNMVLQQQRDVNLWGKANPGKKVTVKPSWTKAKYTAGVAQDGTWELSLPTPAAGGPYTIEFSDGDKEKTVLRNVLLGEVWFCSGQSNMEMPIRGFNGQPVAGATDVIVSAKPSTPIRMCTVQKKASAKPETECICKWEENTPAAVAEASAVGYFFAQKLYEALGVPVGLLISDWGGTPIESWMNRETISAEFKDEFNLEHLETGVLPEQGAQYIPCTLFNGQIAPLIPFTFRGMLWYQGESNRDRPAQYTRLQAAYVRMMRELFRNQDAPFYYVQIAPYHYSDTDNTWSGYFYEAQQAALELIPRSGMAATVDIGEYSTIHPCKKKEVGNRLAYLALAEEYGISMIDPHSPTVKSIDFKDGKAIITMDAGNNGLAPRSAWIEGFELAGEDKVFHPAKGKPKNSTVTVVSPEVPEPVAVRYCFHDWCIGTLYNSFGIPAYPFRSDNW